MLKNDTVALTESPDPTINIIIQPKNLGKIALNQISFYYFSFYKY